jgi:hypothetical protein
MVSDLGVHRVVHAALVVCCHSRQQAEQVKARLAGWLEPRGLAFNEAKTRIVPLSGGFDFLGYADAPAMPMSSLRSCAAWL